MLPSLPEHSSPRNDKSLQRTRLYSAEYANEYEHEGASPKVVVKMELEQMVTRTDNAVDKIAGWVYFTH